MTTQKPPQEAQTGPWTLDDYASSALLSLLSGEEYLDDETLDGLEGSGEVEECLLALADTFAVEGQEAGRVALDALARERPWVARLLRRMNGLPDAPEEVEQGNPNETHEAAPSGMPVLNALDLNPLELHLARAVQDILALREPDDEDTGVLTGEMRDCIDTLDEAACDGPSYVRRAFDALARERPWLRQLAALALPDAKEAAHTSEQNAIQDQREASPREDRDRRSPRRLAYPLVPKELPAGKVLEYLSMNEYGDALFFTEVFSGQVCYDHSGKEWYLWHRHHWRPDTTGKVRQLVAGVLGSLYLHAAADLNTAQAEIDLKLQALINNTPQETRDSDDEVKKLKDRYRALQEHMAALRYRARELRSAKRTASVLTFVQAEVGITAEKWDTNQWALAVPNGVIDLHTGWLRDGIPADFIRMIAPTEWRGLDTPCQCFEQFLRDVFEDKPDRDELIAFLQRLLGYGITGTTTDHVFPLFYGEEGRNGKDTLLGTLENVLGPLVGAVSNDVFIAPDKARSSGSATPHLVDLQGKRLVWGSETKQGDKLNVSQVKHLTGGGAIPARQVYGKQYTFPPTHKLLLVTNYKPHADARDMAFWSRACLIEFGIRFVDSPQAPNERKADHHLKAILKQERSGILAWLVRGCLDWQRQGLNIPPSILLATNRYREEEDRLLLFIEECCITGPEMTVKAKALYDAYRNWCKDNQLQAMSGTLFGTEIAKRFPKRHSKAGKVYEDIGLLEIESEEV